MATYLGDILHAIGEPDAIFPLDLRYIPVESKGDDPDYSEENVLKLTRLTQCDEVATQRLLEAAALLRKDRMLQMAATLMYRVIFQCRGRAYVSFSQLGQAMAESVRMLLRIFSAEPVKKLHERLNIPPQYSRDTLKYLRGTKDNFINCFPNAEAYNWFRQLLYPEVLYLHIVRLGFAIAPRDWCTITFRHSDGSYLTFAKPGYHVDAKGLIISKEEYEKAGGTITAFGVENNRLCGNIVSERGLISTKAEKIPITGYKPYLTDGMPVINMHIPAGGGLTMDLVLESWRQAKAFYRERLGENCPKVIACGSWTCSPVMEDILPAEANLVKFVQSFRRLPDEGDWRGHFIHPGTSLSRAMDTYTQNGGRFRNGSMFLPLDEVDG